MTEPAPNGQANPLLLTARLRLCAPEPEQAGALTRFYERNREHFAPWDPPTQPDFFTEEYQLARLQRGVAAFAAGTAYRYWLTPIGDTHRIIGSVHFSNILRGAAQSCSVGYALDQEYEGQALMTEALRCAIGEMFSPRINLHRMQAAFRPENWRSAEVLKRLGFQDEGLANDYLFIDGAWRVHRIAALRNTAFTPPAFWTSASR